MASSELVTATWVLIGLYALIILYIVVRGALKTKDINDYAVGNVHFSPVAVGLALAASMTSAATFVINPGFIALYGVSGIISMALALPIAALASLFFFTKGFRRQGISVKAVTMAQWIGNRYQSHWFALFFAFLSLLLITFIVLICVGLALVLGQSLNLEAEAVLAGIVIFVFGYMMFGGANAMVYTNVVQASIMVVVAIILLGSGYEHFSNGVQAFWDKLAAIDPALVQPTNPQSPLFRDYFEILFCQILVGIAIVCQPHIITKSLLLKEEKDVNIYLLTGITVQMLFFLVVIAGLYARLEFPDMMYEGRSIRMDSILSLYVIKKFPVYVGLLVVLGLISAGLSTLEGLIQSLSTTITSDIFKELFPKGLFKDGQQNGLITEVAFNRIVIVVLALVSYFISKDQLENPNLSVGIFAQNGVYAYFSAAFVPVLFGTFLKNTPLISTFSASITAVLVHFSIYYGSITPYMQGAVKNPGIASALAILASFIIGLVFYLAFRKQEKAVLKEVKY